MKVNQQEISWEAFADLTVSLVKEAWNIAVFAFSVLLFMAFIKCVFNVVN